MFVFLFLPASIAGYFWLSHRKLVLASELYLCLASLFFYGYWEPSNLPIILISIGFNYGVARLICARKSINTKQIFLTIGIIVNILALCYYKYLSFIIQNLNHLLKGIFTLQNIESVSLPLGVSFFTFQQIAYLVDCSKKTKEEDPIKYTLFITFFPQLIAGPIVHHSEMMPQLKEIKNKVINHKNFTIGIILFLIGLLKKTVLADTFSEYVKYGFEETQRLSVIEGWLVSLSYTFQIYFDFSGYSDMAIGIGKMFNLNLPQNFNSPYKATSVRDFWKRWHMTLSRFFMDYGYIPIGGNRRGKVRTYINLWIVFLLTGIWHGASWMFILWGAVHGVGITFNKLIKDVKVYFGNKRFAINKKLSVFFTFLFINCSWVLFRASGGKQARKVLKAMFGNGDFLLPKISCFNIQFSTGGHIYKGMIFFMVIAFVLVFLCKNSMEIIQKIQINSKKQLIVIFGGSIFLFLCSVYKMLSSNYSEFIYFNF